MILVRPYWRARWPDVLSLSHSVLHGPIPIMDTHVKIVQEIRQCIFFVVRYDISIGTRNVSAIPEVVV